MSVLNGHVLLYYDMSSGCCFLIESNMLCGIYACLAFYNYKYRYIGQKIRFRMLRVACLNAQMT